MHKVALLLAFLGVVSAGNVCPQGGVIYKNAQPVYYPADWRENQTAPELRAGQVCSWTVVIPDGFYAKLVISGKTSDAVSRFQLIDSAGNFIQTSEEGLQPYYFPAAKLTIAVSIESVATFAFKVEWASFPAFNIGGTGVDRGAQVISISELADGRYFSSNRLSVLPFPSNPNDFYAFRSVLVFNGYQANARYTTNLFQIYQSHQQWPSSGQLIYLVNLEAVNTTTDKVIIQNYDYTKDIQQYVELRCQNGPTCTATLDAGSQSSALIDIEYVNRTLTNVEMDSDAYLNVWFGPPRPDNFHYSYNGTAVTELLPLKFPRSDVTQYVISSGRAVLTFSN